MELESLAEVLPKDPGNGEAGSPYGGGLAEGVVDPTFASFWNVKRPQSLVDDGRCGGSAIGSLDRLW
jgi:hypothetical protein